MADPNEVVVVVFPDQNKASEVLKTLQELNKEQAIKLGNAAVIVRESNGHVTIKETHDFTAQQGAIAGALAGGLAGLLRGNLIAGAAAGAVGGLAAGKVVDLGFKDDYLKELSEQLQPNSSAIVAVVHFEHLEEAMKVLDQYSGGKILRQTLDPEVARQLSEAVED